jgi:hypothetical protein
MTDNYDNPYEIQVIYFDPCDHEMDGLGWNMTDSGSVASRYGALLDAISAAANMNLPFVVLSRSVTASGTADDWATTVANAVKGACL